MTSPTQTWKQLGARIAAARKAVRLSQAELAAALGLDRTAVTKLEAGERKLDSLELVEVARLVRRPMDWFFAEPTPFVVARRDSRSVEEESGADIVLETLASDAQLLVGLGSLSLARLDAPPVRVDGVLAAERAAAAARKRLGVKTGPVWNLHGLVERLGLLAFTLDLGDDRLDGSFVRLEGGGVALVNGQHPSGRRRFTLAHELGHYLLHDDFSAEWIVGSGVDERERLVNAFAVHFLLPRAELRARWPQSGDAQVQRGAAIAIGADFGVSWTALIGHLVHLGLIDDAARRFLEVARPTRADYLEQGAVVREEAPTPTVPGSFMRAVLRSYRAHKLSASRAVEMLRGALALDELPQVSEVPEAAMQAAYRMG